MKSIFDMVFRRVEATEPSRIAKQRRRVKIRNLAGALALAGPALAFAQSSVLVYGVVDTGIAYVNGVGANRD
ncbi:hypothetical protein C1X54_34100, partial [Pseudomonas sp. GW460-13]